MNNTIAAVAKKAFGKVLALLVLALLALPVAAAAVTVPSAVIMTEYLSSQHTYVVGSVPGTFSGSGCYPGDTIEGVTSEGCSSDELSLAYAGGAAAITVAGSGSTFGAVGGAGVIPFAYGVVAFYYEVIGPGSVLVPVDFSATGSTAEDVVLDSPPFGGENAANSAVTCADAIFGGYAGVQIGGATFYAESTNNGNPTCGTPAAPASFSGTAAGMAMSNTAYIVDMSVEGFAGGFQLSSADFSATVDPSVTIDSSFTTPGYSLIFSADVTPPTSVPEPTTPMLILAALAAFAITRCRAGGAPVVLRQ